MYVPTSIALNLISVAPARRRPPPAYRSPYRTWHFLIFMRERGSKLDLGEQIHQEEAF